MTLFDRIKIALLSASVEAYETGNQDGATEKWKQNRIGTARGLREAVGVVYRAVADHENAKRRARRRKKRRAS